MDPASSAITPRALTAPVDSARVVLDRQRDRAERMLNRARLIVLVLLGIAALVYAPSLTPALNRVNVLVLVPILFWTILQVQLFYRLPRLPAWIGVANPVADIAAVTAIIGGYAYAQSATLALKTPIFLMYFVILAALPIAASTRKAGAVGCMAFGCYGGLVAFFLTTGQLPTVLNPVTASQAASVSLLDEGAKLLLLAVAGAIATYATNWQERLATSFSRATEEREQLEARLARAQLQSLRLQLHPHFLFNTLHAISTLVHRDPEAADRMISRLSDLLRITFDRSGEPRVSLKEEIDFLQKYLEIEQTRFQDRLTVRVDIDPDALDAEVPRMILQPLVENAIKHGVGSRSEGGLVQITAARDGDRLSMQVRDNGGGLQGGTVRALNTGVGLSNTRARLDCLYGVHHQLVFSDQRGGLAVRVEIPYTRVAAAHAPAVSFQVA